MNWKTLGLVGAGVGFALFIANKFSNGIITTFQGIKWLGLDGLKMRLAMRYRIENTNDIPCTVTKLDGKLKYGEYKLSDVLIDTPVTVQPGNAEDVEVKFTVRPGLLLAEIVRFFDEKAGFKRFRLTGKMTGKIGEVPFITPINEQLGLAE